MSDEPIPVKGQDAALSKTIIGLLIAVVAPIAARYGIDDSSLQIVGQAVGIAVGAVGVWIGRQNASAPITHVAGLELPKSMVPTQEQK